jgi:pre-mRNA-processing factor 17
MHSCPATTIHPAGDYYVAQSLDNEIKTYQASDRFVRNRKKNFKGHQVSGFACGMAFSPNGKFLASGDGNGKLNFWDWNTGRAFSKMNAHRKGPTMSTIWSPVDPSLVATCGWDGSICLWQNVKGGK